MRIPTIEKLDAHTTAMIVWHHLPAPYMLCPLPVRPDTGTSLAMKGPRLCRALSIPLLIASAMALTANA